MKKIERVQRVKVEDNSKEAFDKAWNECNKARILLSGIATIKDDYKKKEILVKVIEIYSSALNINSRIYEPYLAISEILRQFCFYDDALAVLYTGISLIPDNKKLSIAFEKIKSLSQQNDKPKETLKKEMKKPLFEFNILKKL